MRYLKTLVAAGVVLTLTLAAYAAIEKGTVTGKVIDAEGNPVAKATVEVRAPKKESAEHSTPAGLGEEGGDKPKKKGPPPPIAKTKTDDAGAFTLSDLAPGEYVVIAHKGKAGSARTNVTVTGGETESVELTLKPKAAKPKEKDHDHDHDHGEGEKEKN